MVSCRTGAERGHIDAIRPAANITKELTKQCLASIAVPLGEEEVGGVVQGRGGGSPFMRRFSPGHSSCHLGESSGLALSHDYFHSQITKNPDLEHIARKIKWHPPCRELRNDCGHFHFGRVLVVVVVMGDEWCCWGPCFAPLGLLFAGLDHLI